MSIHYQRLNQLAQQNGLVLRGGFNVVEEDAVPNLAETNCTRSLVLFGNAGSSVWSGFSSAPEYADGKPDPMDRWSERIGNEIAAQVDGKAWFPFGGPPYQPFMQWAKKAESLNHSVLGMLIHPQYGLWHAYRFAVGLATLLPEFEKPMTDIDVCSSCENQPCLNVCPVEAFSDQGYDVESCYGFLKDHRDCRCRTHTCVARLACPEGRSFHYDAAHARFHMDAFYSSIDARLGDQNDQD